MPTIDHAELVLRIDGLGAESAAQWAAKAVTMGATLASLSDAQYGLRLTVEFGSSSGGAGTLNLIALLRFAAEIEGHSAVDLVQKAIERNELRDAERRLIDED